MKEPAMTSTHGTPAIEVHDLTVAYRTQPVLWDVDIQLPEGQLIAIVGPNGAGKSTLLKAMLGLVTPVTGWVQIFGEPYARRRSWVGYVPQRESVDWDFPTSALDVVTMGLYGRIGWLRPATEAPSRDSPLLSGEGGHAGVRRPPDQPALGRPATARVPRPRPGPGRPPLSHGRALRRRRRHHRARDPRFAPGAAGHRPHGRGRASRPANRGRVLRPRRPPQHAARGRGPGVHHVHRREPAAHLRRPADRADPGD